MNKTIVKEQQNVNLVQTIARVTAGNLNTAMSQVNDTPRCNQQISCVSTVLKLHGCHPKVLFFNAKL